MSLPPPESPVLEQQTEEEAAAIKALVDSFTKSNVHDIPDTASEDNEKVTPKLRPMRIYTREQLLFLSGSPLVQLPPNMPELKQWFGDNEILLTKKDSDPTTPNTARDRRFRRELEDGEVSSRPSFRSTLSQPSQMGNFKHQSLRSGDRDRERDGDRDRDNRDKEGLRHLSDKYDRDRLGMLPSGTRGKERESVPHANANTSSRTTTQSQPTLGHRRGDTREAQKKRPGETGDDWRRNDALRSARDDRDDRERAKSRARESSRSRRSPSRSRRERDDGKDRPAKNDRDRTEYGRDDYRRDRERDNDRDQEDDSRRWRDDGKRDERMAARRAERDRELRTRERERGDHWEPSSDRRWAGNDDRDSRYKRTSARDRKTGGNADELKDRDERREREKEKEPAWMETYVPTTTSGILGGKSSTGELDGIQAWKKGLKEKEMALQEKNVGGSEIDSSGSQDQSEKGLDEIQIFKLLMKREEEKKKNEGNHSLSPPPSSIGAEPLPTATLINESPSTQLNINSQSMPHASVDSSAPANLPSSKESFQKNQSPSGPLSDVPPTDTSSLPFSEKPIMDSNVYNPPAGSRLLALGRSSAKSPVNPLSGPTTANGLTIETVTKPGTPRGATSFSPFEGHLRLGEETNQLPPPAQFEPTQPDKHLGSLAPTNSFDAPVDNNSLAYAAGRGSRFAKFFDNKAKESSLPGVKAQTPTGFASSSPNPLQRQEQAMFSGGAPNGPTERTMDEIFAMLNNSSQAQRANMLNHPTPHHPLNNNNILSHQANAMNNLPPQSQHFQSNSRLDALYDSRLDDRNFVPDGMVPGLRTVLPPRSRDNVGPYQDLPDEALQFHLQRLQQQQQHRGPDLFGGPSQPMYGPQNGRSIGLPVHQAQFRGGPSPGVSPHNSMSNLQPQRLPPGLANLGARPPHDPAQLLAFPGHPNALHTNLHPNIPPAQQQVFNSFVATNLNNPQLRGPIPNLHQLQNAGPHPGLGSMGLANSVDLRPQNSTQLLGVGGPSMPVPRGVMFNPQQANHLQGPLLGTRQQQAHLPPHVPPHLMPSHFQQPPALNGSSSGHANELIALLMGGPGAPRE